MPGFPESGPWLRGRLKKPQSTEPQSFDKTSTKIERSHETHLPSLQSSSGSHPRFSGPHENPRGARRHQCAPSQGPQASGRLRLAPPPTRTQLGRPCTMTGRIVRSVDFERVLSASAKLRSEHFAAHHVPGHPSLSAPPAGARSKPELSTENAPAMVTAVDDLRERWGGERLWLGLVVPKRHARRSVTRSLFKRQIRAAVGRHASLLAAGLWVVRLKAPFEKTKFPSAASTALQRAARTELDRLFAAAARPAP